jgi:hypothetical protein
MQLWSKLANLRKRASMGQNLPSVGNTNVVDGDATCDKC